MSQLKKDFFKKESNTVFCFQTFILSRTKFENTTTIISQKKGQITITKIERIKSQDKLSYLRKDNGQQWQGTVRCLA